jgi:hypothetical protein
MRRALRLSAAIAIVCAILAIEFQFHSLRNTTVTYSLLLAILFFAVRWDRLETIVASLVAAFGFLDFFQLPVGSLKATDPHSYIAVAAFLITAIVVSQTALTARKRTAEALERKAETDRLYELGQAMLASHSLQTTVWIAINQAIRIFGATGAAFYLQSSGEFHRTGESHAISDDALRHATTTDASVCILSVRPGGETVGSFGICGVSLSETVLKSIAALLAVVLERVRAGEKLVMANQELEQRNQQVEHQRRVSESLLHDYFTAFDQIVARYRIEKMKTIGDSYMCISGLPTRNPAHPVDTVMAAIEMIHAVQEREKLDRGARWKVRIGIHTGPVIAGVVGINKFAFDIWGDTVNYSSRMESSGAANRINLSDRTYSRIKDFFECEHRGKVLTKEKREVDMYFVNGILPSLVNGSVQIPPPAFLRRYVDTMCTSKKILHRSLDS